MLPQPADPILPPSLSRARPTTANAHLPAFLHLAPSHLYIQRFRFQLTKRREQYKRTSSTSCKKTLWPHQLGGGRGAAQRGTSLPGWFTQPSVCEPRPGRKGTQGTLVPKEFPGLTKHKADSGKCHGRVTKIKPYRSSELKVSICPVTEPHFPFPSQCHRWRKTLSFSTCQ